MLATNLVAYAQRLPILVTKILATKFVFVPDRLLNAMHLVEIHPQKDLKLYRVPQ